MPEWLDRINYYRGLANVPVVSEDTNLRAGDLAAATYIVRVGPPLTHNEDQLTPYYNDDSTPPITPTTQSPNPYYSDAGLTAAGQSDLFAYPYPLPLADQSVDGWMTGAFHGPNILDPRLQTIGFNTFQDLNSTSGFQAAAALDVVGGLNQNATGFPVYWPGSNSTVTLTTYDVNEEPDAQARPDQKFYLIIDEINRGDIPRIFGELLTVLEKNKRGKAVLLPLTGEPFSVPDNVYVIGTMNTADRSVALLDTALRRRFGFLELMPDIDVLGDTVIDGLPLGPWLAALNKRIFEHVGRDARNLQLGHSYLFEGGHPVDNFTTFGRIVQEVIFPLLEEYCYEDYTKLQSILGPKLVDSTKQQFRQELFEVANKDQLITALLAIAPEITTSKQAIDAEAKEDALKEVESSVENDE